MAQLKKKVTLRTKIPQEGTTDAPITPKAEKKPSKGKWWIWILLILTAVIIGLVCYKSCCQEGVSVEDTDSTMTDDTTSSTPVDSTINDTLTQTDETSEVEGSPAQKGAIDDGSNTGEQGSVSDPERVSNRPTGDKEPAHISKATPNTSEVNHLIGTIEENARRVIRGDFGNGQERKDKLGASYSEIQSKVNEMYRQGLVY